MKLKIISYILLILVWNTSFSEQKNEIYNFHARSINEKSLYVEVIYENTSAISQCILTSDLEMNLIGDFLIVNDSLMNPVRYIGPQGPLSAHDPRKFIILAPGMKTVSSIYLDKFYSVKKLKEIYLSYRIPVTPCGDILENNITIPSPEFIKNMSINFPTDEKKMLQSNYPDWSKHGFIANMKPLTIKR